MHKVTRQYARARIDDAKLKRLWGSRMSDNALAKTMGHHRSVLRRRAIKIGLPSSRREMWAKQHEVST